MDPQSPAPPTEPTFSATTPPPAGATAVAPAQWDSVLERFARDYLRDRRSERRWRVFFRLAWLLLIAFIVWGIVVQRAATAPTGPHTALIELRGEIAHDAEASAEQMIVALKTAFEDAGSRGVVLRINSPGGSPVQAGVINDEIRRLKAKHQKRVYAVVDETCASAAYYVAVATDEIYVDKASIVGSIGVLVDGFGFTAAMEKLGIERRLLTAGENKAILDPFSPLSEKHRAHAQAMIDQIHQQFITVVKQGRGQRLKESPETFSGLFWNGQKAVELGLADKLGNLDYVAREVIKAEEVIDYTPKENVAERLAKRLGASIGEGTVRAMKSMTTIR
jgi:protease-4